MRDQTDKTVIASEQSPNNKPRRSKSREVTSRFLSPTSESGILSPNQTLSPVRRKTTTGLFTDTSRKHRSVDDVGLVKGPRPSASVSSSSSTVSQYSSSKKSDTLADHLGNERLKDVIERKEENGTYDNRSITRQRSYSSEFSRFEKEKYSSIKENNRPIIGGSMRYPGKFRFSGKTVSSSNKSSSSSSSNLVPGTGKFSVHENALNSNRRRSSRQSSVDIFSGSESSDMLCGSTEFSSPAIGKNNNNNSSSNLIQSSTGSCRLSGVEVASRYFNNQSSRLRRGSSDSHMQTPVTSENSTNNLTQKSVMKRVKSITGYGSAMSQWALSPGRSLGSQHVSAAENNTGKSLGNFSNLRPPNSPSKSKGLGNFLSLGLEMFKSKKSSSSSTSSPSGHGIGENAHELRLLHNRLIQWRYVNATADGVNASKINQAESTLVNAWASLSNLQSSVVQKRIQFEREKLELKLNTILHSQVKLLEAWGDMERQHHLAVSTTKDGLHSVVCRVPLIEGAKVDPQLASISLRHSTDLTTSIKTMLLDFSLAAKKTASLLSEVAEVVANEKILLEECFELLGLVSALEMQERSLKCNIVQLKLQQQQQQQRRQ